MGGRLILVCHAATDAIRAGRFPLDEPLDPRGHAQASGLAGGLGRVDVAYTSPALRARQTAGAMRLDAVVDPLAGDIDLGRWAGQSLADIDAAEPEALRAWTTDPRAAPHGGESVTGLLARLAPWLAARAHDGRRVVVVTHAAVMRAAVILAIDATPRSFWRIDIPPLCRVDLRAGSGQWRLRSIGPVAPRTPREEAADETCPRPPSAA